VIAARGQVFLAVVDHKGQFADAGLVAPQTGDLLATQQLVYADLAVLAADRHHVSPNLERTKSDLVGNAADQLLRGQ